MGNIIQKTRSFFPSLQNNMVFFDNAGGTQVTKQVPERIVDYLTNTNVQLGASYTTSVAAGKRVFEARKLWAEAINAKYSNEIVFGSSTTALLQNLSRAMIHDLEPSDEVILTDCDHEANIGPWMALKEKGVKIITWKVNKHSYKLEIDTLKKLMTQKTKLVAFTHVSNILGTINPVKEITKVVHDNNAKVCVDGVAYAPHRLIDVKDWDVDYYVFSLYKVYGPHYSLLYGKRDLLTDLKGINHYFISDEEIPYKLQPGNVNFELSYGCLGILDYFNKFYDLLATDSDHKLHQKLAIVFDYISDYEEQICKPLIDFLEHNPRTSIIGDSSYLKDIRVPTVSFIVENIKSSALPQLVDKHNIAIRYGDFYARRLIEALDLKQNDGVVRVSMVHYNTVEEVNALVKVLDDII